MSLHRNLKWFQLLSQVFFSPQGTGSNLIRGVSSATVERLVTAIEREL
jgi:hypothetical protein